MNTFNSPRLPLLRPHGHGRWKAGGVTGEADAQTELVLRVKIMVMNKGHENAESRFNSTVQLFTSVLNQIKMWWRANQ